MNSIDLSQLKLQALDQIKKTYTKIDENLYDKYNVKKGLRNSDGTGVMAGLTAVGDVKGYIVEDGERNPVEGRLRYRGINLVDIVNNCKKDGRFGYEEVVYLLLFGVLPTKSQLKTFNQWIGESREMPEGFVNDMVLKAPSANIMNKMGRSVLALYSYDDNPDDLSLTNILRQSVELIARFGTIASVAYQAKRHYHDNKSMYLHNPRTDLSTAENFLYMLRPDNHFTRLEAEILDTALMIHAEHGGGNNSAFATRVLSSSGTDTYSAISAAVGSLKGPKHGGANAKVMGMIEDFKANVKNWDSPEQVKDHIAKIIRKESFDRSGLVYGMGHAIYTLSDPRAVILKQKAHELAVERGREEEFRLYENIEKYTPEVFAEIRGNIKVMCANVDLYSGFVYNMLEIPPELYTPLFAVSRIAGWCAHRIEEVATCSKIIRPAYKSIIKGSEYVPIDERV